MRGGRRRAARRRPGPLRGNAPGVLVVAAQPLGRAPRGPTVGQGDAGRGRACRGEPAPGSASGARVTRPPALELRRGLRSTRHQRGEPARCCCTEPAVGCGPPSRSTSMGVEKTPRGMLMTVLGLAGLHPWLTAGSASSRSRSSSKERCRPRVALSSSPTSSAVPTARATSARSSSRAGWRGRPPTTRSPTGSRPLLAPLSSTPSGVSGSGLPTRNPSWRGCNARRGSRDGRGIDVDASHPTLRRRKAENVSAGRSLIGAGRQRFPVVRLGYERALAG